MPVRGRGHLWDAGHLLIPTLCWQTVLFCLWIFTALFTRSVHFLVCIMCLE